jgi:hypothetical protein
MREHEERLGEGNQWTRGSHKQIDEPFPYGQQQERQRKAKEVHQQLVLREEAVEAEAERHSKKWENEVVPYIERRKRQQANGRWVYARALLSLSTVSGCQPEGFSSLSKSERDGA